MKNNSTSAMDSVAPIGLSIVIPARDEQGNIAALAEHIDRGCAICKISYEIVFVNDGSVDNTLAEMHEAAAARPNIRIVSHPKSLGITEALRTGFKHSRGDLIMLLPADLESNPEDDIPLLHNKLIQDDLDVVCGWRKNRGDGKEFISSLYNALSRWLFPISVHDMNWIKMFKRKCLDYLQLRSDWHRFLAQILAEQGFRVGEVETEWHPRRAGVSKFGKRGYIRAFYMIFDLFIVKFHLKFLNRPIIFFGSLSMIFFLIGFALGVCLLADRLLSGSVANRIPLLLFDMFILITSFMLLMLGILAELIVSLHREISAKIADR